MTRRRRPRRRARAGHALPHEGAESPGVDLVGADGEAVAGRDELQQRRCPRPIEQLAQPRHSHPQHASGLLDRQAWPTALDHPVGADHAAGLHESSANRLRSFGARRCDVDAVDHTRRGPRTSKAQWTTANARTLPESPVRLARPGTPLRLRGLGAEIEVFRRLATSSPMQACGPGSARPPSRRSLGPRPIAASRTGPPSRRTRSPAATVAPRARRVLDDLDDPGHDDVHQSWWLAPPEEGFADRRSSTRTDLLGRANFPFRTKRQGARPRRAESVHSSVVSSPLTPRVAGRTRRSPGSGRRTFLGRRRTESRFTALSRGTGSTSGSRTTSLLRPRIVVVHGATNSVPRPRAKPSPQTPSPIGHSCRARRHRECRWVTTGRIPRGQPDDDTTEYDRLNGAAGIR